MCPPTGLAAGTTTISPLADRPLSHLLRITRRIYKSSPSLRCKRDSKWHWCPTGRDGDGTGTDMKEGSGGCLEAKPYSWWFQGGICTSFSATQNSSANKRNLEKCQAKSGLIASLASLSLPFSPVPLGSLFLRVPQAGEPVPSGFIKTLVAFLHICSIFTVVPSHVSAVSRVSVVLFSRLCHNLILWLKGNVLTHWKWDFSCITNEVPCIYVAVPSVS